MISERGAVLILCLLLINIVSMLVFLLGERAFSHLSLNEARRQSETIIRALELDLKTLYEHTSVTLVAKDLRDGCKQPANLSQMLQNKSSANLLVDIQCRAGEGVYIDVRISREGYELTQRWWLYD